MNLTNQQKNLLEDKTLAEFPTLYLSLINHGQQDNTTSTLDLVICMLSIFGVIK